MANGLKAIPLKWQLHCKMALEGLVSKGPMRLNQVAVASSVRLNIKDTSYALRLLEKHRLVRQEGKLWCCIADRAEHARRMTHWMQQYPTSLATQTASSDIFEKLIEERSLQAPLNIN